MSAGKMRRRAAAVILLLLLPVSLLIQYAAAYDPAVVERFYSRGLYRAVRTVVSSYFNLFPFSCAEIMLYTATAFALFIIVLMIKRLFKRQFRALMRLVVFACCILTSGYFLFTVMWGVNYSRVPLEKSLGYKTGTPTSAELSAVLRQETACVNGLCGKIAFDKKGRSCEAGGFKEISAKVKNGYRALGEQGFASLFGGSPGPKGVLASKLMSYTGIEGIFVPFTYEPNVDTDLPDMALPFDAAHESAHFMGFAREEEANFVAYLADTANPDPYFQYSAHLEAYIYVANALYDTDRAEFEKTAGGLDPRAASDLKNYFDYGAAHKSPAADVSNAVNDSYLKSQGQQGVISYDLFVTLLADKYRSGII